jgi:integrase
MGVYKRGENYYILYYYDGRRIREKVGPDYDEALDAFYSRKGDIVKGKFDLHKVKPSPLFEHFTEKYLEWAQVNHRSYKTFDEPRIKCLLAFFKGKRLHEINSWIIDKFKQARKQKVSPSTINLDLAVLSSMFSRAIVWELLNDHPMKWHKVEKLKTETQKERILTEDEEQTLLASSSGWLRDMIILALDTGMRLSELTHLKWQDVDLTRQFLTVRNTKNGRDRKIPLTSRVITTLLRRKNLPDISDFVFPSGKGNHLWRVRSAYVRLLKRANIKGIRFHDLRHTFATRLVVGGTDIATVQKLLGHQDIRMTQRYSHPSSDDMKKAIRTLEKKQIHSHKTATDKEMGLKVVSITP